MKINKISNIDLPDNYKISEIFISRDSDNFGMIICENNNYLLYKNADKIGNVFNHELYRGIISDDASIIRTISSIDGIGKGLSINGNTPIKYFDNIGIFNPGEIRISKDGKYSYSIGFTNGKNFLIRNDEILLDLSKFKDEFIFSDNGEYFLIIGLDNNIYLNGKELINLNYDFNNIIYYTINNNGDFILVYKILNTIIVLKNGLEINNFEISKNLIYKNFIGINDDLNNVYLSVSDNTESDCKYGVSINGKDTKYLCFHKECYNNYDLFFSKNKDTIVYKGYNPDDKTYYLIKNEDIIKTYEGPFSEDIFDLSLLEGFEMLDVIMTFSVVKDNIYFSKHDAIKQDIIDNLDFDKIEKITISNNPNIVKFIGTKDGNIGFYKVELQ